MRAFAISGGFGLPHLRPVELPEPAPGPGQVVIQNRAVSLNYRDLLMVQGLYNPRQPLPLVPCSDAAGEVLAVGEGVDGVRVGDRVAAVFAPDWLEGEPTREKISAPLGGPRQGTLSERVLLSAQGVVPAPAHLSFAEAATLGCAALTAWHALTGAGIRPGDTVLTLGTGGVSIFALQLARLFGASVIATSKSDEKLARLQALGASHGLNYRAEPRWGRLVRQLTGGVGVDQVIEVGGAGTLEQSIQATRVGGTISLIGVLAGGATPNLTPALMANQRIQGVIVGSREMFCAMNRALSLHPLRPVISASFPFEEAPAAFEHLAQGAHFGKVVLEL